MSDILITKELKKHFGNVRAIDGVDLAIQRGEFISIIGPNGAGKTTLVNLISGLLLPDSGQVIFKENDVTKLEYYKRVKLGIVRSFQLPMVYGNLSVFENIAVSVLTKTDKNRKLLSIVMNDENVTRRTAEILELFELDEIKNLQAGSLPHGTQKILDIAMSFALEPELLILDEPTSGISTREKNQIMEKISSIARSEELTLIVVEHDMDIVSEYSDRVIAIHEGRKVAEGKPDEVIETMLKTATGG